MTSVPQISRPRAKLISLSERFREKSLEDQFEYMHKLASSNNEALAQMQDERDDLQVKLNIANQQIANLQTNLDIQKRTLQDTITSSNAETTESARRIQELEARVKAQDNVIESLNEELNEGR